MITKRQYEISLIFVFLSAGLAYSTPITPLLHSSSVLVQGRGEYTLDGALVTGSFGQVAESVPGAPFSSSVSGAALLPRPSGLPPSPFGGPVGFSSARAVQNAQVTGGLLAASGGVTTWATHFGDGWYGLNPNGQAQASSIYDVIFFVNEAIPFRMAGSTEMQAEDIVSIVLRPLGGAALWEWEGNSRFDLTSGLGPGTYRLTATAQASSGGSRHGGDSGTAGFNFTMDFFSVPDTGSTLALLSVALLACVRLSRKLTC